MMELEVLILNSLFCYGVYISFTPDMVLGWVRELYDNMFKVWYNEDKSVVNNQFFYYLSKPLFSCTICMSSVWGIVFVFFSGMTDYGVISFSMMLHIVCVAGINYLIAELLDSLKSF